MAAEPLLAFLSVPALDYLNALVPDLVVLDLHLPHQSGETILKYIRTNDRLKHVPVVITSADFAMGRRLSPLADAFLTKPVKLAKLREIVQRLLPTNIPAVNPSNP